MPRILLLMPTKTYRASAFLTAAAKLNLNVVVATEHKQALSDFAPENNLTLNFDDPQTASRTIADYEKQNHIDAIIPVDEKTAVITAMASAQIGLQHNALQSAVAAREKHIMRQMLSRAGLPSPGFQLISFKENIEQIAKQLSFPCVTKPTFLSTSRGVIRANTISEFTTAAEKIHAILREPAVRKEGGNLCENFLVEDYIPGDEVALEGILTSGKLQVLAIFDKPDPMQGPYFEETIYVTPSRHQPEIINALQETAANAAHAMGIQHGPVHVELRINSEGVWVIEIAARSIGGLCSRALRFQNDILLEELILMHALGQKTDRVERENLAAGVMMIPIPEAGILQEVKGVNRAKQITGVEDVIISIPLTQRVVPMPEGNRYLGFIFARGETPEDVERALRKAHSALQFNIR